jgi:hypothetical protein
MAGTRFIVYVNVWTQKTLVKNKTVFRKLNDENFVPNPEKSKDKSFFEKKVKKTCC